jgi:enoyl-CoA hydratase/carnithine racemase
MTDLTVEEAEPGIFVVTMNRPEKLNTLALGIVDEMHDAFDDLGSSKHVSLRRAGTNCVTARKDSPIAMAGDRRCQRRGRRRRLLPRVGK